MADFEKGLIDCVVQNGWLIRVKVVQEEEEQQSEQRNHDNVTLLVSPETTVSELKELLQERLGVEPKEQRIFCVDRDTPLFYGKILDRVGETEDSSTTHTVRLQRVRDYRWIHVWKRSTN